MVLILVLLQHSSDLQGVQLIGDLKFAVVVSLCMNGCLSVCVTPETNQRPVHVVPCLLPCSRWDRLQLLSDPDLDEQKKIDGWMQLRI